MLALNFLVPFTVALTAVVVGICAAETCQRVTENIVVCEETGTLAVQFSCPTNYIIKVSRASYRTTPGSACPASPAASHCVVATSVPEVLQCNKRPTCDMTVPRRTTATCSGVHYINVVYNCEALQYQNQAKAGVTSMTNSEPLPDVQLAYITSDLSELTVNDFMFNDTSHGCLLTVPADVQVSFQLLYMIKNPDRNNCKQRIQIWDGVKFEKTVCGSNNNATVAGCDVSTNSLYIKYINDDPSVYVGFIIAVKVSHRVNGFNMACGLNVSRMVPVVVPDNTTMPDVFQDTTEDIATKKKKSMIIVVTATGGSVFFCTIIAILAMRYRKHKRTMKQNTGSPTLRFRRPIALDDQHRNSTLVMQERPRNTRLHGLFENNHS